MTLEEALQGISVLRFYKIAGHKYHDISYHRHLTFDELPPRLQLAFINITLNVYQIQKMVYSYDIHMIERYMKKCGIKLKQFYHECDINATFYRTLTLSYKTTERLMKIRQQLIKMLNRLFEFITS